MFQVSETDVLQASVEHRFECIRQTVAGAYRHTTLLLSRSSEEMCPQHDGSRRLRQAIGRGVESLLKMASTLLDFIYCVGPRRSSHEWRIEKMFCMVLLEEGLLQNPTGLVHRMTLAAQLWAIEVTALMAPEDPLSAALDRLHG